MTRNLIEKCCNSKFKERIEFIQGNGLDNVVNDLFEKYDVTKINHKKLRQNLKYVSMNVIPRMGMSAEMGYGALIITDKGALIDLASQTVNTILGQNDIWVLANLIAFNKSAFPSFLTSRIENKYTVEVASYIASVGGITNATVNHRICSGAGAIEALLTTLWEYRLKNNSKRNGKNKIATLKGGFHGQTGNAGAISYVQKGHTYPFRFSGESFPFVIFLNTPDNSSFDANHKLSDSDQRILEQIKENKKDIFLVLVEPILMNNGVITLSSEFIRQLKKICEENDILLAYDEIQTAYGWLGEMSASERIGVSPHMLAVSKGLTGGFGPLGATIGESRFQQEKGTGESTNGSDLRSLVAAKSCYERLKGIQKEKIPKSLPSDIQEELRLGLLRTVKNKAKFIRSKIQGLVNKYQSFLWQLRGDNMIIGIPIKSFSSISGQELSQEIYKDLLKVGVYVRTSKDTIVIKPPLTITDEQVVFAIEQMDKVFKKYDSKFKKQRSKKRIF